MNVISKSLDETISACAAPRIATDHASIPDYAISPVWNITLVTRSYWSFENFSNDEFFTDILLDR
jgi:hypothetical protein